jgi:anti-sigma-K factor RskA
MNENHILDDLPAYVLGVLNSEEHQYVETHISKCADCRKELLAYQKVTESFLSILPLHNPPAGLKSAILNKVSHPQIESHISLKDRFFLLLRPLATPAWGGISLLLILLLGISNINLFQQTRRTVEPQSEFSVVQMVGQKSAAGASGVIVMTGDGNFGTLVVDSLPVLDTSKQYQLWLIKEGKRTSGGVFSVMETGYGVLVVNSPQPLSIYDSFGVTVEPSGGSPNPTGSKVLGGSI